MSSSAKSPEPQQDTPMDESPIEQKDFSGSSDIRCLVDNIYVGALIGKAGANLKQLREDSGCFVSIPKAEQSDIPDRLVLLKGTTEQASSAVHLIAQTICNSPINKEKGSATLRVLVHRSGVGAVIGKMGATIRETQALTGARVVVSNDALPGSSEKAVSITGTADTVRDAFERVLQQLKENPLKPGVQVLPYVPAYQHLYRPSRLPVLRAPLDQGEPSTQKIAIPTICAGCVIGKNGSVIRDVRQQSSTNISIADPEPNNPDERVVTLIGTAQGIQTAVGLIRQLVERFQPQPQAL